jgi:hypothetical protein
VPFGNEENKDGIYQLDELKGLTFKDGGNYTVKVIDRIGNSFEFYINIFQPPLQKTEKIQSQIITASIEEYNVRDNIRNEEVNEEWQDSFYSISNIVSEDFDTSAVEIREELNLQLANGTYTELKFTSALTFDDLKKYLKLNQDETFLGFSVNKIFELEDETDYYHFYILKPDGSYEIKAINRNTDIYSSIETWQIILIVASGVILISGVILTIVLIKRKKRKIIIK